jgi:hypothetical protein
MNKIEKLEKEIQILKDGLEIIAKKCLSKYYDNDNNNFLYETYIFAMETIKESEENNETL